MLARGRLEQEELTLVLRKMGEEIGGLPPCRQQSLRWYPTMLPLKLLSHRNGWLIRLWRGTGERIERLGSMVGGGGDAGRQHKKISATNTKDTRHACATHTQG